MKHVVELMKDGESMGFAIFDTELDDISSPVFATEELAKEFLDDSSTISLHDGV